jgi:S1-C subfamily serine protease
MAVLRASILALLFTGTISYAGESRTWTDTTGKYRIEAELISADANFATLKKADGSQIRVPVDKLSSGDRALIASLRTGTAAPEPNGGGDAGQVLTYDDLQRLIRGQREAVVVASLIEGFLESNEIAEHEKELARDELPKWQQRADENAVRVVNKWITPDEFRQMKEDEIRLIKEAHRLIDIKSDELAKEKFLDASQANPQSVRADFYLGLLNALVAHHRPDANKHFRKCIGRLLRDDDLLTGSRRANLVAALNNLAIIQVRLHHYDTALSLWRQAIDMAPFTPELVQNLGLMAKLAQTATYVSIPKGTRDSAANLYAKVTVDNNLARFDDRVGWLVIPYIDTLDGSMDESGDEEMVTVAWCTGFSVGGNYVVTSRYPLVDADRIVVHEGGNVFEIPSGKVVAISNRSNLALLRIDGLNGTAFPWSADAPKPAQDVTISGYREPGFTNETFQSRTATIVNMPNVLRHVETTQHSTGQAGTVFRVAWFNYRDMLIHDAITSAGMEGAPLIDQEGRVVGIHIGNRAALGAYGSKYSMAEPSHYAISFLRPIVSDLDVRESGDVLGKPPTSQELQGLLKSSIYQLSIQKRAPRLAWSHRIEELHRRQRQGAWTSYEDKTCMACNGQTKLECSNRGCNHGMIKKKVPKLITKDERTGSEIWGTQTISEKCPVCHGEGLVDCPNCGPDGIDKMLR